MLKEFTALELTAGVKEALVGDGAIIRGLIDSQQAKAMCKLVPDTGKQRVYLNPRLLSHPDLRISQIEQDRRHINQVVTKQLGRSATLWGTYVMRPDILRAGKTKPHVDGRGAIISGSLNLELGAGKTIFSARRLTETAAPYSEIEAVWEQNDMAYEEVDQCILNVGDMAIVSRGVIHGSFAPADRKSVTYRTRGLVPGDFK